MRANQRLWLILTGLETAGSAGLGRHTLAAPFKTVDHFSTELWIVGQEPIGDRQHRFKKNHAKSIRLDDLVKSMSLIKSSQDQSQCQARASQKSNWLWLMAGDWRMDWPLHDATADVSFGIGTPVAVWVIPAFMIELWAVWTCTHRRYLHGAKERKKARKKEKSSKKSSKKKETSEKTGLLETKRGKWRPLWKYTPALIPTNIYLSACIYTYIYLYVYICIYIFFSFLMFRTCC